MKYKKTPFTFREQLTKLKERGLKVNQEEFALKKLSFISFYRLRAYTFPFQDNNDPNHPFTSSIDFETIIQLYEFDAKLRILIFEAIEKIEIAFRTQIIYQFALNFGSHWQTNPTIFRDTARFAKHLETLNKEISRSDETFIDHYRKRYTSPTQPPAWVSLEVASMGTLSKFFQNLAWGSEKQKIVETFGLPNAKAMENWMFSFSHLRNICAHHGRLWNRRLTALPFLPYNIKYNFLSKEEAKSVYKNKLYATLCCIRYILNRIESKNNFNKKLKKLIANCPLKQENEMGFTKNWENHVLWN